MGYDFSAVDLRTHSLVYLRVEVHASVFRHQRPHVRYEELFRRIFFHVFELQVGEFLFRIGQKRFGLDFTWVGFRNSSALTRSRSFDHCVAPFEITSNTSCTPSSPPRCSCTRCSRDEKNPTTCELKSAKVWEWVISNFEEWLVMKIHSTVNTHHIDVLDYVLKRWMASKCFKDLSLVQQRVN